MFAAVRGGTDEIEPPGRAPPLLALSNSATRDLPCALAVVTAHSECRIDIRTIQYNYIYDNNTH